MPAIYAHYSFGNSLIAKLQEGAQRLIFSNKAAFDLGLQGPDFLFFKNFGMDETSFNLSGQIHKEPSRESLEIFKQVYLKDESEVKLAYILGYIGHFVLDTYAHEYITRIVKEDGIDHNEVESEFDRFLILAQGENPLSLKVEDFIRTRKTTRKEVAELYLPYDVMGKRDIEKAIKDFYVVKKGIRLMQKNARPILISLMKVLGLWEKTYGIIINKERNQFLDPYVKEIYNIYLKAGYKYPSLVESFFNFLKGESLDEFFDRNFEMEAG